MSYIFKNATPESCGVHSRDIINFIEKMCKPQKNQETHSFMLMRHGKVLFEGYFSPYGENTEHTLFSISKSFASIAIGYLAEEGKVSVDDYICDYFPELLVDGINPENKKIKIRDLLSMSFGQTGGAVHDTSESEKQNNAMLYDFFYRVKDIECGEQFRYDSYGTYMLAALVFKLTGKNIAEYIYPKLFEPLDIKPPYYVKDEIGISIGYSGIRLKMRDLAKVGDTLLNNGKSGDMQLIPEDWVKTMLQKKIDTTDVITGPDWKEGYCYQLWRGKYNTSRLCGAFGQMCVIMPDYDAIFVIFSGYDNDKLFNILDAFYENIMFKMEDEPLEENSEDYNKLNTLLSSLNLVYNFSSNSPMEEIINGKEFEVEKKRGYNKVRFDFNQGTVTTTLISDEGNFSFCAGFNKEIFGEINGTHFIPMENYDIATTVATACWKTPNMLEVTLRLIGTPTILKISAEFDKNADVKIWTLRGNL